MKSKKKCALILPYFGKFNNYFPLFLRSIATNTDYDLIIFTDNKVGYDYPKNVRVIEMTLDNVRELAENKFGFKVSLKTPYKLCDYKPSYGFLFEEYIKEYLYWGHCDCDLIFGNLNEMLTPLLEKGFDKIFAAGHLTLYKNTPENNKRFMKPYNGELIYKEAFTSDSIYVLDEDIKEKNVHRLFLSDGAYVYETDLSMNPTSQFARFRRSYYSPHKRRYTWEPFKKARYYWNDGNIVEAEYDEENNTVKYKNYLYLHLQMRKMRVSRKVTGQYLFEILPDRFIAAKKIPQNKREMKLFMVGFPYFYWFNFYFKRLLQRIKALYK